MQDGTVEIRDGKLLVCGFETVGKTTMVHYALKAKQPGEEASQIDEQWHTGNTRTAGFDVVKMQIPSSGAEPWTVVDFAGHMEYYVTHEMLLKTENAIFIIMCNLNDEW